MMIPMLFNTEMVQAIMAGRKTQTRRIVRKKYDNTDLVMFTNKYGTRLVERQNDAPPPRKYTDENGVRHTVTHMVAQRELDPPCKLGDILWVRETWCENKNPNSQNFGGYEYRADYEGALCQDLITWSPSIHMPKKAARIFLRVKDVRVERLQSGFSKDGAAIMEFQKEGVEIGETCTECIAQYGHPCCIDPDGNTECGELDNPRYDFSRLWDSTIKPADLDKYGWNANPWVWVIEFERCAKPEGWCV